LLFDKLLNFSTSSDIGNGQDMFGEGNLGVAFLNFPNQHVCNHFCKWFELAPTQATILAEDV
jgi:hypothetical protein